MKDEELDEMLQALTLPRGPEELSSPQMLPVAELALFATLALALLAWAFFALSQIFSA